LIGGQAGELGVAQGAVVNELLIQSAIEQRVGIVALAEKVQGLKKWRVRC